MTGNRRTVTQLLTMFMSDSHLYTQTYRIETESSPEKEKSIYTTEELSINNTRTGASLTTPVQSGRDEEELLPLHKEGGHMVGGAWDTISHPSFISTREINLKHIHLPFLSGFWVILFRQKLKHLQKHTLVFFSPSYIHIHICFNPLWFTFTVCATTSHGRGRGFDGRSLASWDVDWHQGWGGRHRSLKESSWKTGSRQRYKVRVMWHLWITIRIKYKFPFQLLSHFPHVLILSTQQVRGFFYLGDFDYHKWLKESIPSQNVP